MPLRPFPYQIGIGTDIAHVNRVRAIIEKDDGTRQHLDRYLRRFLTRCEREEFQSRYGSWDLTDKISLRNVSRHLSGRWAAKEATIKAVSWRKLTFHDIVIRRPRYGGGMHAIILDRTDSSEVPPEGDVDVLSEYRKRGAEFRQKDFSDDSERVSFSPLHGSKQESHVSDDATLERRHESEDNPQPESLQDEGMALGHTPADQQYDDLSGQIAQISISHDGEYATAVCLAAQEPMDGDEGAEAVAREHL